MFILVLVLYAVAGIFLLPFFKYQINPDGVSYLSLARQYLHGEWWNAVNGYWGPLFSWLLVPFLYAAVPPTLAAKILALLIGFFAIIGTRMLSCRFHMSETTRTVLLFALIPVVLHFAFFTVSPDLLLMGILVFYLYFLFDPDYSISPRNGVLCGIAGGLAYLTKSYSFPFFLVHFVFFHIFQAWRLRQKWERKMMLRNAVLGLAFFAVISGSWAAVLSLKYSQWTFGTSGAFTHALSGPESKGLPGANGFVSPPTPSAVSAWDDPTYADRAPWSPFDSRRAVVYQMKAIAGNVYELYLYCLSFTPLAFVIILASFLLCFSPSFRNESPVVLYSLFTIFLYPAGYLFIFVRERFLWILFILIMLMGGHLLQMLLKSKPLGSKRLQNATLILFALSLVFMPTKDLVKDARNRPGESIYQLSRTLKDRYHLKGNLAANDRWTETLYLSFFLDSRFYGLAGRNWTREDLGAAIKSYDLDDYLVWKENGVALEPPVHYGELTGGQIPFLKIFSLKPN